MYAHHRATIERLTETFAERPETQVIIIGGSIAHGFETPASDVDVMIVASDDDYARRLAAGDITTLDTESPTYAGGYVDVKYVSADLIRAVAARGSEPARYAFDGAIVAWSRLAGIEDLIRAASQYPAAERDGKLRSFRAQVEAWHWYCGEAFRLKNPYLLSQAAPNLVLFAGRLVLAHNAVLYPYHKWFLRVLGSVEHKPDGLLEMIDAVVARPEAESIEALYQAVCGFTDWPGHDQAWGARFMLDTELAWLDGRSPIGDL